MIIDFVPEKPGRAHILFVTDDGEAHKKPMTPTRENLDLARHLASEFMKWVISNTGPAVK